VGWSVGRSVGGCLWDGRVVGIAASGGREGASVGRWMDGLGGCFAIFFLFFFLWPSSFLLWLLSFFRSFVCSSFFVTSVWVEF
jgi:hypothetical protein